MLLRIGTMSKEVGLVQHGLNLALPLFPLLNVDGIFGPKTDARVRQFQSKRGLKPDGLFGPLSIDALFTGVEVLASVIVRPRGIGPPRPPPPPVPAPSLFNPFVIDPRDVEWHKQVQAWRDWANRPFPPGPAPPLPPLLPPSMILPPAGLSVPPLPVKRVPMAENIPISTAAEDLPFSGANFETQIGAGFKSGKIKLQEFKFKVDFVKIKGLIDGDTVKHEIESEINSKGELEVEQKVTVTPFKLFGAEAKFGAFKATTLLITSINSSFDVSAFAGVKAVATFRPFGKGFEVEVGGKLGPKFKLSHDEDGHATSTVYPVAGEGTVGFEFRF